MVSRAGKVCWVQGRLIKQHHRPGTLLGDANHLPATVKIAAATIAQLATKPAFLTNITTSLTKLRPGSAFFWKRVNLEKDKQDQIPAAARIRPLPSGIILRRPRSSNFEVDEQEILANRMQAASTFQLFDQATSRATDPCDDGVYID